MNIIGVDLGRKVDYATINIYRDKLVQRAAIQDVTDIRLPIEMQDIPRTLIRVYDLVYLDEMRGVSYPVIGRKLWDIVRNPQLSQDYMLIMDATGVGIAVIDMLREVPYQLSPIGVTFTSGKEITMSDTGYNVPKRDLVTNMQLLFQTGRIKVAKGLKHASEFKDQLRNFSKLNTSDRGTVTYGNATEEVHDDFVMGGAIALWYVEKVLPSTITLPNVSKTEEYNPAKAGL